MRLGHSRQEAGFTFAELAFGMLILVISAAVLINHLAVNYQTTASERDRVFAFSKAQAILSEIQSYVDRGELEAVALDVLDDGVTNKWTLSIQTDSGGTLIAPDHVVSGNWQRNSQWLWSRRITVQPFAGINNRNVRYITVRVYKRDAQGTERPLADLSAVVNSAGDAFPSTQVLDVYLLAIENIPGWWVFMDSMRPFVESMIMDLEIRNPGLEFRSHWITKSSFGRNQAYRPYTNDAVDTYTASPDVYFYPGRMPAGNASPYYYVPNNMRGRINVDGTERNGYDGDLNEYPYALADFFNHAMRYPDELALWQARVAAVTAREQDIAAAIAGGTTPPPELTDMSKEPTLRLFLEDLYSSPDKYKNALVLNLHGELLPMPPLRNYADAARTKDDASMASVRVVTHPEELRTRNNDAGVTDSLRFRMYAYEYRTSATANPLVAPIMSEPMVVEIMGVDLVDPAVAGQLKAGVNLHKLPGRGVAFPYTGWAAATTSAPVGEMYYRAVFVPASAYDDAHTRIFLFNTPTACTPDTNNRGLRQSEQARLYEMDYVPNPVQAGAFPAFSARDLMSTDASRPKNTARWTLELTPSVLTDGSFVAGNPTGDVCLKVRTRIATGFSVGDMDWERSGRMWPDANDPLFPTPADPDNLSVTYAWWTDSAQDVPFTERAQFNGDPRHLPYADCFNTGGTTYEFQNHYNWYHDDLNNGGEASILDYPVITAGLVRDHWGFGAMACDVPRYMQLLREGLVKSRCVYSTMTGWSYYYLGIGNDIGYDSANGYPNSIPSNLVPFGSASNGYINTITGVSSIVAGRTYVRQVGSTWTGFPWLGELAPADVVASQWLDTVGGTTPPRGNLTAGTGANQFYQRTCNAAYAGSGRTAYGTAIYDHLQRTHQYGCTAFFNIGSSAATFQHNSTAVTAGLTPIGLEIANNYNMTVPPAAPVTRPFRLNVNVGAAIGEHWLNAPYSTRYTASTYRTYYTQGTSLGSAAVKLVDPGNTNAAYVVVNGIGNAVDNGTTFIAKYSLLSMVHTMLEAGSTTNTLRIQQQPRVEITAPTNITELVDPASIPITWGVNWTRWDGLPYSATGTFNEDETLLEYVPIYSRDGGETWLHVEDNTPATPGYRPTDTSLILADTGVGDETATWSVPLADFPEGTYQLRIECFRQGAQVHYSYHQTSLFIQR